MIQKENISDSVLLWHKDIGGLSDVSWMFRFILDFGWFIIKNAVFMQQ